MGTHNCGNHVVKSRLMIGESELNCGMIINMGSECDQKPINKHGVKPETCCQTDYYLLQISNEFDFSKTFSHLNIDTGISIVYMLLQAPVLSKISVSQLIDYSSPPLINNIISFLQVFLI